MIPDALTSGASAGITWTTLVFLLGLILRQMILTYFKTRSDVSTVSAGETMLQRLLEEIKRLESIIEKQEQKINSLEEKITAMNALLTDDMTDIAEINAIVVTMCSGNPECTVRATLRSAIDRLIKRRQNGQ